MFAPVSWFGSEAPMAPAPNYTFTNWPSTMSATGEDDLGSTCNIILQWDSVAGDVRFFRGNTGNGNPPDVITFGSFSPADTNPDLEYRFTWSLVFANYSGPGGAPPGSIAEPAGGNGVWFPMPAIPGSASVGFGINAGFVADSQTLSIRHTLTVSLRNMTTGSIGSRTISQINNSVIGEGPLN